MKILKECPYCHNSFESKRDEQKTCGALPCIMARRREYNRERKQVEGRKKATQAAKEKKQLASGMRKCHDCDRMTYDYRCPACWQKLRKRLGLKQSDLNSDDEGMI